MNQPILAMTKPGSAPYNGLALYGKASPERVSILGFKYMKGQGLIIEVYERVKKSVISAVQRPKRAYRCIFGQ